MDLKNKVYYVCFLWDKGKKILFFMSAENKMDLGELLAYLLEPMQVEEIIIAWSYI
jgi:hypothetical protein